MSVEERVIEIVSEQMGVAKDQVTRETSFVNDLGADSLESHRGCWDRRRPPLCSRPILWRMGSLFNAR